MDTENTSSLEERDSFVHLHLHTEYSLQNGMIRLQDLAAECLQKQMPAVAVTDISNLFAAVKFFRKAVAQGVKPILGAEVLIDNPANATQPFCLVLLVQDASGYVNLSQLLSKAYRHGQKNGRVIIDKSWLQQHARGLIALSAGLRGEIGSAILAHRENHVTALVDEYRQYFADRFYLEIQRVGHPYEEEYIAAVAQLASKESIPLVATNDAYFMREEEYSAHEVRVCINEGRVLNDPRRVKHHTSQQYFKSATEMAELFADLPSAIDNTLLIAKKCNFELHTGEYFLPDYPVEEGETIDSSLRRQSLEGLERVWSRRDRPANQLASKEAYEQRMEFELQVIEQMGFPGYFLIVADFIRWAKENGVPVGPGRGSGAGSLAAYALGITDLDPIEHELLFERFLNPERVSMPDFDIDFCIDGRERVIDYVAQKYGRERVSQIITYGTMAAKGVVRDVGRVLGMSYGHVDGVAKLIPFEIGMTLHKALDREEELAQRYEQEEEIKALFDMAFKLEGLARNVGKHAGGVVIAPSDLTEFVPIYCEPGSDQIVAQYDKDDLETIGLVKFDFLGLKTLTIIDWALREINLSLSNKNEAGIDITQIGLDDAATYQLLCSGQTTAIFQLESVGMKELIKNLRPDQFNDVVALVALYRPGPLGAGMEKVYCERKHGRQLTTYPHDNLIPILEPTYGVILYQEQVMQIAQVMAGYSLGSADILRRAMGKKKVEEMAQQREVFESGAADRGIKPGIARSVFDQMEYFAEYGFNKSHSAAYALIAYQTAWLKAHYPAQFIAACMSADMENTDKVVILLNEAKEMGLHVNHPNINLCEHHFRASDEKTIIYGLGAIKGIGQAVIEEIVRARGNGGDFDDLFDLCARLDLKKINKRGLEALVRAGALDELGAHRASLLASIDLALNAANQQIRSREAGQSDLFGVVAPRQSIHRYENVPCWSKEQLLKAERDTLGLYLSGHPIDMYLPELSQLTSSRLVEVEARQNTHKSSITLAGLVVAVRVMNTRGGSRVAFVQLDDKSARLEVGIYGELYEACKDIIHKDKILMIRGKASKDNFTGGLKLSAEEVYDMEQVRLRFARFMRIDLDLENLRKEDVARLKEILRADNGASCRFGFSLSSAAAKGHVQAAENWTVRPSNLLLERISELVGLENIHFFYKVLS